MSWAQRRSRSGASATAASRSPTASAARPVASSASTRSSTSDACISDQRVISALPAIRVRELRCPPPEAEGVVEVRQRARGVTGTQGVATGAGRLGVAGAVGQHALERPATAPGHHDRIPEPPTDRRDVGLERLGRGAGRRVAPEQLDQGVGRDDGSRMEAQQGEDGPGLGSGDGEGHAVLASLEGPQHPQFHDRQRIGGHAGHGGAVRSRSVHRRVKRGPDATRPVRKGDALRTGPRPDLPRRPVLDRRDRPEVQHRDAATEENGSCLPKGARTRERSPQVEDTTRDPDGDASCQWLRVRGRRPLLPVLAGEAGSARARLRRRLRQADVGAP